MATNIEITAQLNQMLAEQNQLYLNQAKIQRGQLAVMQAMAEAMGDVDVSKFNESFKTLNEQITAADEAMKKMNQTGQKTGTEVAKSMSSARDKTNDLADATEEASKKIGRMAVAAGAIEGAMKGFQLSFGILRSVGGILDTVLRKFGQFAMAIIRFPIGIWNFLFEKATSGGGGGELRQTLENIRKEFGDLSTNSSKAIIDMAKSMKGPLAETGLSVYRTFGNLAERLKTIAELAKALGPLFNNIVARGMIKSAEATLAFQKGLGLSNEQMKTVARTALISGTTVDESLREMANYAIQLGDAFGLNAMEISRDMAEMETDMKHFGGLSRKELGETAVYAKKLGVEVKALAGIMDAFDNLDTAAQAAARLNQQFGLQIETMQLLKMENPAERFDYLRQRLEATGRSFEALDRRSQQYFATQMNITQEEAALIFAQENRGMSLDQIKKKSGEAEKKQLSQAEAMQKLAGSIERLVKSGGGGAKTLFGAFVEGFERAIFRSREFRQIMRNIRLILRRTRLAGLEVGRAFIDMFPGVKGIMGGLADLFNPERWKRTMSKVVDAFKAFFRDLQTNPEAGLKNLFERLKRIFFDHFDSSAGAGRKLIENFKLFFITMLRAGIGGLKAIIPTLFGYLTTIVKGINGFLRGDIGLPIDTSGLGGQMMMVFRDLFETIKQAGAPLWEALKELLTIVFNKVSAWYNENKLAIWGFLFGPAIIRSIAGGFAAALTKAAVEGVTKGLTSRAVADAGSRAASTAANAIKTAPVANIGRQLIRPGQLTAEALQAGANIPGAVGAGAAGANAGAKAAGGIAGLQAALPTLALMTLLIPLIAGMMYLAIQMLKGFTLAEIGVTAAAMAAGVAIMFALAGLLLVLKFVGEVMAGTGGALSAAGGLGLIGITIIGIAAIMYGAIQAFKGFTKDEVDLTIKALGFGVELMYAAAGLLVIGAIAGAFSVLGPIIGVGFTALALVISALTESVSEIMTKINTDLPTADESFIRKMDAFVKVIEAITGLQNSLGNMLDQTTSFSGVILTLLGHNPLTDLKEYVTETTPLLNDIIRTILTNTAGIESTGVQAISALSTVIQAMTGLIEVLSLSDTGFFTKLFIDFDGIADYAKKIRDVLVGPGSFIENMSSILQEIGRIPMGSFNIEAVQAFGSILTSFGGILSSFSDVFTKVLDESWATSLGRFLGSFVTLGFGNVGERDSKVNAFVTLVKDTLKGIRESGLVNDIKEIISSAGTSLSGLTKDQVEGIGPLSQMMSAIFSFLGNFIQSFQLDPEALEAMANATSVEGLAAAERAVTNLPTGISTTLQTILDKVRTEVGPMISALMTSVSGFATADIEKASSAGQVVTSLISGISSFMTSIKEMGSYEIQTTVGEGAEATQATLRAFDPGRITTLISSMSEVVTAFFNPNTGGLIRDIVSSLLNSNITSLPRGIGEKAKAVVDILGLVSAVTNSDFKAAINGISSNDGTTVPPADINRLIGGARTAIDTIVTQLGSLIKNPEFQSNLSGFTTRLTERMGRIPQTLDVVGNILTTINSDRFDTVGLEQKITGIRNTISAAVAQVNEINGLLANLTPINLNASLERLGNVLGMRSETLAIRNENFSITINLDVHIDAADLEAILERRAGARRNNLTVNTRPGGTP